MTGYLGLLGLAHRAGFVVIGDEPIRTAAAAHKVKAVFLASDAAENIRRKMVHAADFGKAPLFELPCTKEALGAMLGKGPVAAAAVTGIEFACGVAQKLSAETGGRYEEAVRTLENKAKARRTAERRRGKAKRKENA